MIWRAMLGSYLVMFLGTCLVLALCALPAKAAKPRQVFGPYPAQVERVIDADTVVFRIRVWPDVHVTTSVRVFGVNTPETRTRVRCEKEAGLIASAFVKSLLHPGAHAVVNNVQFGKWAGRVIATVRLPDGRDLGTLLVAEGHAVNYFGGKREKWCEDE